MSTTESNKNELLRGGQFLVKETKADDVFTPEDFTEEQKMMRDSVKEFVDREIWPHKERLEQHDYALTEEIMQNMSIVFDEHADTSTPETPFSEMEDKEEELSDIRLDALKHRLEDAVNEENYELATRLRDEINRRENRF